jgi:hypothetical protein
MYIVIDAASFLSFYLRYESNFELNTTATGNTKPTYEYMPNAKPAIKPDDQAETKDQT